MHDVATSTVIRSNPSLPGRAARIVTACLLVAAMLYAGIAATWRPQELPPSEVFDLCIAGALPGLPPMLIACKARPDSCDRRLRWRLTAFSLDESAVVASLPLLIVAA